MRNIYISLACLIFTTQLFSQVIDTQFGENGKINTLAETSYKFTFGRLFVQSNNKIVAFQNKQPVGDYLQSAFYITRYDAGGIIDSRFGNNGAVEIRHLLNVLDSERLDGIKILQQPDKKILAVIIVYDRISYTVKNVVIRINTNGSIDSSYGNNGVFKLDLGEVVTIEDAGIQGNKLILGGYPGTTFWISSYNILTRITEQGSVDASFGENGVLKTLFWRNSYYENIHALVVDPLTQSIFCTGETYQEDQDGYAYMAKCTPDGQVDSSFPTVYGYPGINPYFTWPYGIDISPDHQFICFVATAIGENGTYDRDYVWQVRMDGTTDSSFGLNGRAEINWRVLSNTMRFGEDKKLYFSGEGDHDFDDAAVTVRMNRKGHKDTTYGEDGATKLFDENYTYSNNFDFHKRPGSNKGLVLSVVTSNSSFIIRYHEASQNKLSGSDFSAATVTKEPKAFAIYPNPVKSQLYVSINTETNKRIQINIVDISGKQLRTQKITANGTLTTHAIDISRLPVGIYLLTVITDNGVSTGRFIKE
jgi:uncharacterized delta-60 repeat protein